MRICAGFVSLLTLLGSVTGLSAQNVLPLTFQNGMALISQPGDYSVAGDYTGPLVVNVKKPGAVRIVLNGLNLDTNDGPALLVLTDTPTTLSLAAGSDNVLQDGSVRSSGTKTREATVVAAGDLAFEGLGNLTVKGLFADGIQGQKRIILSSLGTLTVSSKRDGLVAKDQLQLRTGSLTVNAQARGLVAHSVSGIGGQTSIVAQTTGVDILGDSFQISGGQFQAVSKTIGMEAAQRLIFSGGNTVIQVSDPDSVGLRASRALQLSGTARLAVSGAGLALDVPEWNQEGGTLVLESLASGWSGQKASLRAGSVQMYSRGDGLLGTSVVVDGADVRVWCEEGTPFVGPGQFLSGFVLAVDRPTSVPSQIGPLASGLATDTKTGIWHLVRSSAEWIVSVPPWANGVRLRLGIAATGTSDGPWIWTDDKNQSMGPIQP